MSSKANDVNKYVKLQAKSIFSVPEKVMQGDEMINKWLITFQ